MSTTAVNNFDLTKGSAKIGKLHVDKLVVANGGDPKSGGWKTYTPTLGTGAIAGTSVWRYKIDGTTLRVQGNVNNTSGTTGAGNYTFTLPTGCSARDYTATAAVGSAFLSGNSVQAVGVAFMLSATTFGIYYHNAATTITLWSSSSHADLRLGVGTAIQAGCELTVELAPTCDALAGSF